MQGAWADIGSQLCQWRTLPRTLLRIVRIFISRDRDEGRHLSPPPLPKILSKTMLLFAPTKRSCIVKRDVQNRRNYLGWHRPRHLFGTEEPRKVYFNNTCVERARRRFSDGLFYFGFSSFSLECLKKETTDCCLYFCFFADPRYHEKEN